MPLVTTEQWAARDRAIWDWSAAEISGSTGLPRLAITRWLGDRISLSDPNVIARVPVEQLGEHDYEFTLGVRAKLRLRWVEAIRMPEGPDFEPELGALQVLYTFTEKPPTNRFPMLFTLPANARMEYQPDLTPEEISGSDAFGPSVRPPWCLHSYAVCAAGGYKLGHLPRPFAYEVGTPSNFIWGEWDWNAETGTLTKVIPQAWLDAATYPIVVDDTFGQTAVGGSSTAMAADYLGGHGPYSPGSDGTLDSVSFYTSANETGTQVTLGLYNDNSGTPVGGSRVVDSAGGAGVNNDWCTQSMDSSESIAAASSYWFGRFNDKAWTGNYDASGSIDWIYNTGTSYSGGNLPTPFPSQSGKFDWEFSIYGTYTPTGGVIVPVMLHHYKMAGGL